MDHLLYAAFCGLSIVTLKEMNTIVFEPYMDEPFHVPQAQAYCEGNFSYWDPKITTPPGLYALSVIIRKLFVMKCTLPMLRLTSLLPLLIAPLALTRLLAFHERVRPPLSILEPRVDAIVLSFFPIAWFYGFLYYTETSSLFTVALAILAATEDQHWLAAFIGLLSCTFRQNNIIWVIYAFATSRLMEIRFRRPTPGEKKPKEKLHDPPALQASLADIPTTVLSAIRTLPDILTNFVPYALVLGIFAAFVVWNGGIVLGDKSNHVPALHIPQFYYFLAFSTAFGWPVLVTGPGGLQYLFKEVKARMFGSSSRKLATLALTSVMALTVHFFTIHHPFLLSDNRHYTFYVWRRVYLLHPVVPFALIPLYIACGWAWFIRVGQDQSLLQTLLLPLFALPTLLPTPLLEPRYFLIPYILMRAQVQGIPGWGLALEGLWYGIINAGTMYVFLYLPREGVGRFMW